MLATSRKTIETMSKSRCLPPRLWRHETFIASYNDTWLCSSRPLTIPLNFNRSFSFVKLIGVWWRGKTLGFAKLLVPFNLNVELFPDACFDDETRTRLEILIVSQISWRSQRFTRCLNFILCRVLRNLLPRTFSLKNYDKTAKKIKSVAYLFNDSSNYHEVVFQSIVVVVIFVVMIRRTHVCGFVCCDELSGGKKAAKTSRYSNHSINLQKACKVTIIMHDNFLVWLKLQNDKN